MDRRKVLTFSLILLPLIFIVISLGIGRYPISLLDIAKVFLSKLGNKTMDVPEEYYSVIWNIRLPRSILGALVGGSLAVSGAAFQGLFRNPLVNSGILGVSSGAGFGAALAILLFGSTFYIHLFAFFFGALAVVLSYLIAKVYDNAPNIMLVLGGVIVSSVFSSLISLIKYIADPYNKLPAIVFWLMGSLASARWQSIVISGVPMTFGIFGLFLLRWKINILSMGDREAHALGLNPNIYKGLVVGFATMATAGAVAVSGVIGWVGLIIPHICRMIVGNDNRLLMPASFCLGACFLILVDTLGRMLTGSEIPLSILTSLIGGPFFVYLLRTTKAKGGNL